MLSFGFTIRSTDTYKHKYSDAAHFPKQHGQSIQCDNMQGTHKRMIPAETERNEYFK